MSKSKTKPVEIDTENSGTPVPETQEPSGRKTPVRNPTLKAYKDKGRLEYAIIETEQKIGKLKDKYKADLDALTEALEKQCTDLEELKAKLVPAPSLFEEVGK